LQKKERHRWLQTNVCGCEGVVMCQDKAGIQAVLTIGDSEYRAIGEFYKLRQIFSLTTWPSTASNLRLSPRIRTQMDVRVLFCHPVSLVTIVVVPVAVRSRTPWPARPIDH
jgi:hypothetical protein